METLLGMKSKVPKKPVLYILLTIGFFVILIVFDKLFGFHYEPVEYETSHDAEHIEEVPAYNADSTEQQSFTSQAEPIDSVTEESEIVTNPEHTIITPENLSTSDYFENLINNYKTNVLSKLEKNKSRTDIVIRYYHHQPDGNSAYVLDELGYYIHEREVDSVYRDFQSNAIFYGDSVSLNDLQIVSYTLINQGLPIKIIKPSRFHDSWKAHSIEIGADTTSTDKTSITLEQLRRISL